MITKLAPPLVSADSFWCGCPIHSRLCNRGSEEEVAGNYSFAQEVTKLLSIDTSVAAEFDCPMRGY